MILHVLGLPHGRASPRRLHRRVDADGDRTTFFWLGVARIGGRPAFDAWKYPFSRFDDLTLPQLLFAWDAAGIAINPPRQTSLIDIDGQATVENQYSRFTLVVVDGGLGENGTLF